MYHIKIAGDLGKLPLGLTENYQPTDIEYTINDYSINQNKITYSKISKPLYPQFIFDDSFALSLCSFHDVEICYHYMLKTFVNAFGTNPKSVSHWTNRLISYHYQIVYFILLLISPIRCVIEQDSTESNFQHLRSQLHKADR